MLSSRFSQNVYIFFSHYLFAIRHSSFLTSMLVCFITLSQAIQEIHYFIQQELIKSKIENVMF